MNVLYGFLLFITPIIISLILSLIVNAVLWEKYDGIGLVILSLTIILSIGVMGGFYLEDTYYINPNTCIVNVTVDKWIDVNGESLPALLTTDGDIFTIPQENNKIKTTSKVIKLRDDLKSGENYTLTVAPDSFEDKLIILNYTRT